MKSEEMNPLHRLSLLPLMLFFTACATNGVSLGDRFVVAETPPTDKALVYVFRWASPGSPRDSVQIHVDGEVRALLPADAYARLHVTPGRREFSFPPDGPSLWPEVKLPLEVHAGDTYYLRYYADFYTDYMRATERATVMRVEPEKAIRDLKKCCALIITRP